MFQAGMSLDGPNPLILCALEFHASNGLGLRTSSPTSCFSINLNGIRPIQLRPRSGDVFVFHEIFTCRCYELPAGLVTSREPTIVDLGANIGMTTLFFSSLFPRARHICVEPNPANAAMLLKNLAFLNDRLIMLEAAVSDTSSDAAISDSPWSWGGHLSGDGPASRYVHCVTIDEIISRHEIEVIDVLKIDIEGAEQRLFSKTPGWLHKVRSLVIELHGDYTVADLQGQVRPFGFSVVEQGSEWGNTMTLVVPSRLSGLPTLEECTH